MIEEASGFFAGMVFVKFELISCWILKKIIMDDIQPTSGDGGIARHSGLKIRRLLA